MYLSVGLLAVVIAVTVAVTTTPDTALASGPPEPRSSDILREVSDDPERNGQRNEWGCTARSDSPHESSDTPGRGWVQAHTTLRCVTRPPSPTTSMVLGLDQKVGIFWSSKSLAINQCPDGFSGPTTPQCSPPLPFSKGLMIGSVNWECEDGSTKDYRQITRTAMTVDGVTYSATTGRSRDNVYCTPT